MKLSDRRVLPFIVFGVALSLVQGVTVQTIAFYFMDRLGMALDEVAQFVAVGFMGSALAALFAQLVVVQRYGMTTRALMRGGIGLAAFTYLLFVIAPAYGPLTFAMVLQGLAFGLARPGFSAAASLAVDPDEQGMVAGLLGSTGAAGHIVSPLVVLVFYQGIGPASPYLLCLGLLAALFVSLYFVPAFRVVRERQ
jgi:MFS family permease